MDTKDTTHLLSHLPKFVDDNSDSDIDSDSDSKNGSTSSDSGSIESDSTNSSTQKLDVTNIKVQPTELLIHPKSVDKDNSSTLYFSTTSKNNKALLNSHVSEFTVDNIVYYHVDGYYSACKYIGYDNNTAKRITNNISAKIVNNICKSIPMSDERQKEWNSGLSMKTMRRALYVKYLTSESMCKELLSTGDKEIIYLDNSDEYWGVNMQKEGKNMLGKLLVEIRELISQLSCDPEDIYGDD